MIVKVSGGGSTHQKCSDDHFLGPGNSGKVGEYLTHGAGPASQGACYFGMSFIGTIYEVFLSDI